ncbi:hypothetical protein POJ06DRAFT_129559 [Lipomyces tetrasporus]|uniref:Glycosyltransferase 2-like domain-containing protein n=1 Tax=Lipomyces tetrasporus TaxID=54092 RepID=A0AAD7QPL2_9ASCO|nr:uncharacterized protein POJ06DRAFT_129559 [Lipomyces tetrasporus]KAJ8099163.1 hypothetical protein POJ06DRAFT_129559 [Lipomyces tetrasporus]
MRVLSISATVSATLASAFNYACRCTPGLSTLLVIALIVFGHDSFAFVALTLVCHVFVVSYTARSCYGIYATWKGMLRTADEYAANKSVPVSSPLFKPTPPARSPLRRADVDDLSGSEVSSDSDEQDVESSVSSYDMEDTIEITAEDSGAPIHAIFVPNYKESFDTLRETLSMLASHPMARSSYDVYLAMEAQEKDAESKASILISEFSPLFRYVTYTVHPGDLPGEARGKSSNLAWATRAASRRYRTLLQSNVVFTTMDADTHLLASYFQTVTAHCVQHGTATFTMFVPPIVFDRNARNISPIVRCADILWSAAGIAGLYETSQIRPPTSVYSVTMTLARYVDFWDTGPEAIGEDLHMYLKCFFRTRGRLNTVPVYSPASHCNVEHGDATPSMNIAQRWFLSSEARFKQACRHMWGILDSGYAIRHTIGLITGRHDTAESFEYVEQDFLAQDEELSLDLPEKAIYTSASVSPSPPPLDSAGQVPWKRVLILLHRLYEAHFLPVHYFIDVLACSLIPMAATVPTSSLLSTVLVYTNHLRKAAAFSVILQMVLYERVHTTALQLRLQSIQTTLSSPSSHIASKSSDKSAEIVRQSLKQVDISRRGKWINCLDYVLFPIAGTFFGAVPAIKAQILQFWGTSFVYEVSRKPTRSQ